MHLLIAMLMFIGHLNRSMGIGAASWGLSAVALDDVSTIQSATRPSRDPHPVAGLATTPMPSSCKAFA